LAKEFRRRLDGVDQRVFTSSVVKRIDSTTDPVTGRKTALVKIKTEEGTVVDPADFVVLAVPPSAWWKIDSSDEDLQRILQDQPKMGSNVKFLMAVRSRVWRRYGGAPSSASDTRVNDTWETTEALDHPTFGLVAFSGANDADACRKWPKTQRKRRFLHALRELYPTLAPEVGRTCFMNWPKEQWSWGSYYFARRRDIHKYARRWFHGLGWLHFAGEHMSFAFPGYMEGALRSGHRVARVIEVHSKAASESGRIKLKLRASVKGLG
jgi:monoamine oxidase